MQVQFTDTYIDGLVQERHNSIAKLTLIYPNDMCIRFQQFNRYDDIDMYRFTHDGVMTWIHIPCYWPFVRGIH